MVDSFYHPFKKDIEHTLENVERIKGERELGVDKESGKKVVARMGRFGLMVQIGDANDEEKPRFATLKPGQSIETITLQEALDLFKLPFTLGDYEGAEVSVGAGRFGPYVKHGEVFISIPRGEDPLTIDMERAVELIKEKQEADAPIGHYEGKPVTKGKGRFGPFIKWEDLFVNVPKAYDFDNLSQKDIDELITKKVEKEANRYILQWPEEKISVENGRWGPFIRFGKLMLKLEKTAAGEKPTAETAAHLSLEEVKKMIANQIPDAFEKKTKALKKAAPKKAGTVKKAAAKKATPKKAAAEKK